MKSFTEVLLERANMFETKPKDDDDVNDPWHIPIDAEPDDSSDEGEQEVQEEEEEEQPLEQVLEQLEEGKGSQKVEESKGSQHKSAQKSQEEVPSETEGTVYYENKRKSWMSRLNKSKAVDVPNKWIETAYNPPSDMNYSYARLGQLMEHYKNDNTIPADTRAKITKWINTPATSFNDITKPPKITSKKA